MAAVSQSVANCSGLIHHAKLPFGHMGSKINNYNAVSVTYSRILRTGIQCLPIRRVGTTYAASVGKDHHQLSFDDEVPQEPFFLSLFKETVWSLRSLFVFLFEQPSQLKYIEWPGFRSTVKINVNGAWDASTLKAGVGVIIRNEHGSLLLGWSIYGSYNSPVESEAAAVEHDHSEPSNSVSCTLTFIGK